MSSDSYLREVLNKYVVNTVGARAAVQQILPVLQRWGGAYLLSTEFAGSLAKGTAIRIGTDADLFLSISSAVPATLEQIYDSLFNTVTAAGYQPRKQNVSIGVRIDGYDIDLVPGRRQSQYGNNHSLYKNKTKSWTLTNVASHINTVSRSGRLEEIRILKVWRALHNLPLPSFLLEMAVIDALHYARNGNLAANVWTVLEHLRDNIERVRYVDPANTNNVISDDCNAAEKAQIASCAHSSCLQQTWKTIVW